ncbi:hypothetical protein JYK00_04725 [Thermosipho ferrireducens]|uniref:Uncharacterized protein n=1 Tax=Thermosipho ferrireducens TaxID=2571116 RepID=A0ABX7SA87_9BACT|nr:hypothetical protein [Thermosipho ferrireducens]QTA38815.1 hypothetical protein JYK00_04725 [Thermosipho ferrireducens]
MKFFYNLARSEFGEYVVVEVTDGNNSGLGAIFPEKVRGENYKTIMGAIEEYRPIVEKADYEDAFWIVDKLNLHFPDHPKVTFAIDAAFRELYSKISGISLEKLIGYPIVQEHKNLEKYKSKIYPEYLGSLNIVKDIPKIYEDNFIFVLTKYPHGEMWEVLKALSTNYQYTEVMTWKERLFS